MRRLVRGVLVVLSSCALVSDLSAMPQETDSSPLQRIYKSTVNAGGEPVELMAELFLPEGWNESDRRPAVVFFFGGGWQSGSTAQFHGFAREFAEHGLVAITADYRVRGRHQVGPPACVEDGRDAIRFVRTHADELGVDPDRVVAAGGSAGGHVAACTALRLESQLEAGDPSVPNALILFNPVLDTSAQGFGHKRFGDRWQEFSPVHLVRSGVPPTLLFHGTADKTVSFASATAFEQAMQEAGNSCELVPFQGRGHGFFNDPGFRKSLNGFDYQATIARSCYFLSELGYLPVAGAD